MDVRCSISGENASSCTLGRTFGASEEGWKRGICGALGCIAPGSSRHLYRVPEPFEMGGVPCRGSEGGSIIRAYKNSVPEDGIFISEEHSDDIYDEIETSTGKILKFPSAVSIEARGVSKQNSSAFDHSRSPSVVRTQAWGLALLCHGLNRIGLTCSMQTLWVDISFLMGHMPSPPSCCLFSSNCSSVVSLHETLCERLTISGLRVGGSSVAKFLRIGSRQYPDGRSEAH